MRYEDLLSGWEADWRMAGRAPVTARNYGYALRQLLSQRDDVGLVAVKQPWVAEATTAEGQRFRGRAARAFFRWADTEEVIAATWWKRIPLANVAEKPQETVTSDQFLATLAKATTARDRALVAVPWCSGLRVGEFLRMHVEHLEFAARCVLVPQPKTGKPRLAPLDPRTCKLLRAHLRASRIEAGPLWLGERGPLTDGGVRQLLRRLGAPPAHAWRRGWAVESLRAGVSQVSVQVAGGWRSGVMVSRYTAAVGQELSMAEFERRWAG